MLDNPVYQSTFTDGDVPAALQELFGNELFLQGMQTYLPAPLTEWLLNARNQVHSIADFQGKMAYPLLKSIEQASITALTDGGIGHLSPDMSYLFISNHRDIVLDSAYLNVVLFDEGFRTSQIAIGDNLIRHRISELIFKLNKSFIVKRSGGAQELYQYSVQMSEYIQHLISTHTDSVWIAQREGRAKDGNDRTQPGLLKMFSLSAKNHLKDYFKSLHIVPVSISYEFDPCDLLKTQEYLAKKRDPEYKKDFREDVKHILLGLNGHKGRVHFHFDAPLDAELDAFDALSNAKKQLEYLAGLIDRSIHLNYALHPVNYIACDLLQEADTYSAHYSTDEKAEIERYFDVRLAQIPEAERADGRAYLLGMYANPLLNYLAAKEA